MKRCSVCKELLPWDALGCPECGAGRQPRAEAPAPTRPWYLPAPRVSIAILTVLCIAAAGLWWTRRDSARTERLETLRNQRATLVERLGELETRRIAAEEQGRTWKQVARQFDKAAEHEKAEDARRKADAAFALAADHRAAGTPVRSRVRALEDEIRALGETP
jgi:hypothetical protein